MATESTKIQVSLKNQVTGTLINLYAEGADDLNNQLDSVIANHPKISEVEALVGAVQVIQNAFATAPAQPQPVTQAPAGQAYSNREPAAAQPAATGAPQQYQGFFLDPRGWLASTPGEIQICSHGPYEYKSGLSGPNSKNPGQPYEMYVCRAPKNGGPGLDGVFAPQHPTQSKPRQWGSR